ncbi:tyrosine-type recombinase/integrase [Azohydromonas aeria]|uniref:tyrosine-type recombinase/integrase n=1 Tax=Azohydromonas aeria TaxID=2590212 RepID=UPI0012F90BB3|nr:hypothetical protein [Azohydromonas aeria]
MKEHTLPTPPDAADADAQRWHADPVGASLPRLSPKSRQLYTHYWLAWRRFLAGREVPVEAATPIEAVAFLAGERLNPTTQARYRRVLGRVHAGGVVCGALPPGNPFDDLGNEVPRREQPRSVAFTPPERAQLLRRLEGWHPLEVQPQRDRLLICLLLADGFTLSETAAARVEHLGRDEDGVWSLEIGGPRRSQWRTMQLSALTADALAAWLPRLPKPETPLIPALPGMRVPLSRQPSFRAVQAFLQQALQDGVLRRLPGDTGPAALRNSAIVAWLSEGVPHAEILRRAGLQRLDALDRLAPMLDDRTRDALFATHRAEDAAGVPHPPVEPAAGP